MEVDSPRPARLLKAVENAFRRKGNREGVVVDVAAGGGSVSEETVGPRLAGRGGVPVIAYAEALRELADYRYLLGRKEVHRTTGIKGAVFGCWLGSIVGGESAHGSWVRGASVTKELFVHVLERFTWVWLGRAGDAGRHSVTAPNSDGRVAIDVVFVECKAVIVGVVWIQPAEHAVERAVFEHEYNNVVDLCGHVSCSFPGT